MINCVGLVLIIVMYSEFGVSLDVKPVECNCIEVSIIDMPSNAAICRSPNFNDSMNKKVDDNFQRIHKELQKGKNCDFKGVEKGLQNLRSQIDIITKILSHRDADQKMLKDVMAKYDAIKNEFISIARNATVSESNACANIIWKIRTIPLSCAENLMAAVSRCLNFKSSRN